MLRASAFVTGASLVLALALPAMPLSAAPSPAASAVASPLSADLPPLARTGAAATPLLPAPGSHRYGGVDRYDTAARISAATYPAGADTVIIATGSDYPDALAAAPLAARLTAPLLLTQRTALPASTAAELARLAPSRIILIGGTGVITPAVADAIGAKAGVVPARLSGADRYVTAEAIARFGWSDPIRELVVATGSGYADALSASAVASRLGSPLVLVPSRPGEGVAPARSFLNSSGASTVHIAGGEGAVSKDVQTALVSGRPTEVVRYAGADRFQTSALLLQRHFPSGTAGVFWAGGMDFPDAVAGSAAAGATGSAVALTRQQCVPGTVLAQTRRIAPSRQIALGGAGAVSDQVLQGLQCFDSTPSPTIGGSARVGSTLTAAPGTWAPSATTITYQWVRNGSPISAATGSSYRLVAADTHAQVAVRTTAVRAGYAPTTTTSSPIRVLPAADLGNPHSSQVVVNKKRPLSPRTHVPTGLYTPKIDNVNGQPVKWEAGQQLEKMSAAARTAGYSLYLLSGYRSHALQQSVYNGYVTRQGRAIADLYSARPGYSEHQTGLAVDLYARGYCQGECFGNTAPGLWLRENAHRYGFILRYDRGMQAITGYAYEPWHFRYVGVAVATDMRNKRIKTLEEYYGLPAAPNY